jgi:hypothetical protein
MDRRVAAALDGTCASAGSCHPRPEPLNLAHPHERPDRAEDGIPGYAAPPALLPHDGGQGCTPSLRRPPLHIWLVA